MVTDARGRVAGRGAGRAAPLHLHLGVPHLLDRLYRPAPGSLLWVVAAGRIWGEVATYSGPAGRMITTRLVAFDRSGRPVLDSPPGEIGESGVAEAGGALWSAGQGAACQGPLRLWRIDPSTGRSVVAATLSPHRSCITAGPTQVAAAGRYAFVLDPAQAGSSAGSLCRVTP